MLTELSSGCCLQGAYVVKDSNGTPDVIIMGTGSELQLAYEAAEVSCSSQASTGSAVPSLAQLPGAAG